MSYYQGDFYQGDFYQGDPGFLGGLFKGIGAIGGFLPGVGGIISKVAGKVGGALSKGKVKVLQHPTLSAAGAAGSIGALGGAVTGRRTARMGASGVGPLGTRRGRMHPGIGGRRRGRRMRVTNVKALRRAIRRAKGFEKLARKVMHFTSAKPPKGRAHFRLRRRSK